RPGTKGGSRVPAGGGGTDCARRFGSSSAGPSRRFARSRNYTVSARSCQRFAARGTAAGTVSAQFLEKRRIVGHEAVAAEGHEAAHKTHVVDCPENDGEAEPARKADAAGRRQADVRVEGEQPDPLVHGANSPQRMRREEPEMDRGHGGAGVQEGLA